MNNRRVSPRLTLILTAILTLIGITVRTVCLLCCFDADPGYFAAGPLPSISRVLYFAAVAVSVISVLLTPKSAYSTALRTPLRSFPSIGLGVALGVFTLLSLVFCVPARTSNLLLVPTILGILAALYPILSHNRGGCYPDWLAFLGYLPVLWSIAAVGEIYFDPYIPMNNPIKVSLQMGLLGFMLIGLAELRFRVGRPLPRYAAIFWSIGSYTCLVGSIPVLLATGAGVLDHLLHVLYAAVLLFAGIYGFYHLFCLTALPPAVSPHTAE